MKQVMFFIAIWHISCNMIAEMKEKSGLLYLFTQLIFSGSSIMKNVLYLCIFSCIASGLSLADATAKTADGRAIFDRSCSLCHSINPPPKSAPPVVPLANRYHMKFQTKEQGVAYMAAFLKKPDRNKAVDPQAVSRFGLMPTLPLTDAERKAVAAWFWDQYNPAMGGGRGIGGGQRRLMNQ